MSTWQHKARLLIAILAVAFGIVVAFAFQRRVTPTSTARLTQTDPEAVVESAAGRTLRINRDQEEIRIEYDRLLTYADGSSKLFGVTLTSARDGRAFVVRSAQAQVDEGEADIALDGRVWLTGDSGMEVKTEHAIYQQEEGIVRATGPVEFTRGRMRGSGVGFAYDSHRELITLAEQVAVHIAAGRTGAPEVNVSSTRAELNEPDNVVSFDENVLVVRGDERLEANSAVMHLGVDESKFEAVELRGQSRITGMAGGEAGGMRAMTGQDIDLKYASDGERLERATATGDAVVQFAGVGSGPGRRITAEIIDASMASDGTTPRSLSARRDVELLMPGEQGTTVRTIRARTLDASGRDGGGLSRARFTGQVRYTEQGDTGVERVASSGTLETELRPGLGAIDEARFAQEVRFTDGQTVATAALARYTLNQGLLELSGTEPANPRPHVRDNTMSVDADQIDVAFDTPLVEAAGQVKSVYRPEPLAAAEDAPRTETKRPSMLKSGQDVNVSADRLSYDGAAATASYSGDVRLWQAETTIKAGTLVIDQRSGDLTAVGTPVATTTSLVQQGKDGTTERSVASAKATEFRYEEALRRATYVGDAYANGPQGDLRAVRIELYLRPSGDELERAEAYEEVALTEGDRKTSGSRMTFSSADQRYLVSGAPVTITDSCGGDMIGRTVTWDKLTERVIIDGSEQMRTRTQGGTTCP